MWGLNRLEGHDLAAIGPKAMRHGVDDEIWNGLNVTPARPCWDEQSVLGSVDESGPTPTVTFELPEKPAYDVPEFFQQYIAVSVSGFDRFSRDRNVTFFPPYLPDLNEYYGRELYFHYAHPAPNTASWEEPSGYWFRFTPAISRCDLYHRSNSRPASWRSSGLRQSRAKPGLSPAD